MGRDSALWTRPGLVGITGGKLTTHRATAAEVLRALERQGVRLAPEPPEAIAGAATRLEGRLGAAGAAWVAARPAEERAPLAGTPVQPRGAALVDARGAGAPASATC
jgi:glycerol-3-phosphate dehydrogenase